MSLCAYTMLSSCLNALAAVHSSHTLTMHTFLSVSVMLCICMFQPSIDGKLVPVNVLKLVFIWRIFLSICYPLALVFSLPVLCHRLCVSASTPRHLKDSHHRSSVPPCRSDRQPWDENTGCEIAAWDIYISLPGCLHASDTFKSGRVAVYDIKNISHKAGGVALQQLTILILKQTKWEEHIKLFA